MDNQQAREVFDEVIGQAADPDRRAGLEVAREYFTNAAFRAALEQASWERQP